MLRVQVSGFRVQIQNEKNRNEKKRKGDHQVVELGWGVTTRGRGGDVTAGGERLMTLVGGGVSTE